MTAPLVTALPTAPSRLSRATEFVRESALFLAVLPTFRTQINNLSSYVNSTIINPNNYGKITDTNSFPSISQHTDEVVTDGSVVDYVASVDDLYSALQTYSAKANEIGTWVDNLLTQQGVVPYDLDKPMVSGITYPMFRSQTQEDFNTSAALFTETAIDNINSMYKSIWFNWVRSYSADDYGKITDTNLTVQIDCGNVTDTNITI